MSVPLIVARRPSEVALQVETLRRDGHRTFIVSSLDHGGMLDQERLGAARYAAGLQSKVELGMETPVAVAAAR